MLPDPVYPLTSVPNRLGLTHRQLVREFLRGGTRLFQVRAKELSDRELHAELAAVAEIARQYPGARFMVNDRCDMTLAVGASGVHLGQDDLPPAIARKLLGSQVTIGVSTHTETQFMSALELEVDYLAIGPVYRTSSKQSAYEPLGPRIVASLVRRTSLPVVAIGGITLENAVTLWDSGVASVAVISDIVNHQDPADRVRQYIEKAKRVRGD